MSKLNAQNQNIDSLKYLVAHSKEDTILIRNIGELAFTLQRNNRYEEAKSYIKKGLALAEKLKDPFGTSDFYRRIGDELLHFEHSEGAIFYYEKSLVIEKKIKRLVKVGTCNDKIAAVYLRQKKFSKALPYYFNALDVYKTLNDSIQIVSGMHSIVFCYFSDGEKERGLKYQESCIDYLNKNHRYILPDFYQDQASLFLIIKDTVSPDKYYDKALEIVNAQNNKKGAAEILYTRGNDYFFQQKYEAATNYYLKALNIYEEIKDTARCAQVLASFGSLYENVGNYSKALDAHLKELKYQELFGPSLSLANTYNSIGWMYKLQDNYKNALVYFLKSKQLFEKLGDNNQIAYPYGNLGITYNRFGDYAKAIEYSKKALKIFTEMQEVGGIAESNNNIGNAYRGLGDYTKSLEYLNKGLKLLKQEGSNNFELSVCYAGLSNTFEKLNKYKEALYYHKAYTKLRESILNTENSEKLSRIENSIFMENKQKEIDLATKEALQQKKIRNSILVGSFILFLLVLVSIYLFIKTKKINQRLDNQKKEIQRSKENLLLLGEIGKKITSTFDIKQITLAVYNTINNLMDASTFAICVVNKKTNSLDYPNTIEKGVARELLSVPLDNKNKIGVLCVNENKEIIINDYEKEFINYIDKIVALRGEQPESLIYIPISNNNEVIGAITVQSFQKNAYTNYHIDLLRNIAVYASIAIQNAKLYESIEVLNAELENNVNERTKELVAKNKEVEQVNSNIRQLSAIGKKITSELQIEKINRIIYENVNALMDASVFAIGVLNREKGWLEFNGAIEKNEELPYHVDEMSDKNRYSTYCVDNKKEVFINDIDIEYSRYITYRKPPVSGEDTESMIFYPLITNDTVIGVITVQSFSKHSYTASHLEFIKNIAIYAAIAIQNANTLSEMEKQKVEIERTYKNASLLSQIGKDITSTFSIEEIINKVYANLNNLMDATVFGVGVFNKETDQIYFPSTIERGVKFSPYNFRLTDLSRPAVWCYTHQKEYIVNHYKEFIKQKDVNIPTIFGETPESMIYLPLSHNDKKIGVITVQSFSPNAYTDYHVQVLKALAVYIAIAIDNANVYNEVEEQNVKIEKINLELEHRVEQRTEQLKKKSEEIETANKNIELLSEIGKEITSTLDIYKATRVIYSSVNNLMNASVLGIGIFNPHKNELSFKGLIEKDEYLPDFLLGVNEDKLACICFREQKEIVFNDARVESKNLIKETSAISGDMPESLIYLPLISNKKVLGVLTVQSFEKNAYNEYHLFILRNLAVYTAITLDNYNSFQKTEIAYEKLKSAQSQLVEAEKMASLGQLTAGVAHEINNPINYISGGIDSLKVCINEVNDILKEYEQIDKANSPEELQISINKIKALKKELDFEALKDEIKNLLSSIKTGANRTTEIVKSLRTFSRLDESGLKKANIEEGIDSTLVILRSQLKERIEIIKNYSGIPEIMCYPGQLNQVFMNIIANAAQAIPAHGKIWISTSENEEKVFISIKDNGKGMPAEVKKRIFEPFFTTKEVGEGTGLGLSIVIGIIEKHKGKIDVISEEGSGTEFIIEIFKNLS